MQNNSSVIVRAYGDEPVVLQARSCKDGRVEVVGSDESKPISLPQDAIFSYSLTVFDRLKEAYVRGDSESLAHLWQTAPPYTPAERDQSVTA